MGKTKKKEVVEQPVVEQPQIENKNTEQQEVAEQAIEQPQVAEEKAMKTIELAQLVKAVKDKQKVSVKSFSLCVGVDARGQQNTETVFRAFVGREVFEITFDTYKKFNSK